MSKWLWRALHNCRRGALCHCPGSLRTHMRATSRVLISLEHTAARRPGKRVRGAQPSTHFANCGAHDTVGGPRVLLCPDDCHCVWTHGCSCSGKNRSRSRVRILVTLIEPDGAFMGGNAQALPCRYLTLPLLPLGLIACRAVSATDLIGPRPSVNGGNGGGAVGDTEEEEDDYEDEWVIGSRPFSFSRVAVGALLFPYTA